MNDAQGEIVMETNLVRLDALLLGGMNFYGDPFSTKAGWDSENEIGKTWQRFIKFTQENPKRPYSRQKPVFYEIHIFGPETEQKGCYEIFVGEEVKTAELPIFLSAKFIAASDYLKITLYGKEMVDDWCNMLDTKILPSHGLKRKASYLIEAYDERFHGMDRLDESVLDVYIPVEKEDEYI
jgi:predicted transcriptional regulator YdeE